MAQPAYCRMRLRFSELKYKAIPYGSIQIDEALDRLGRARFPDEWGLIPGFEKLPFAYDPGTNTFFRNRIVQEKGLWNREARKLVYRHSNRADFLRNDKIYKAVHRELRSALEKNLIKAKKLYSNGQLVEIDTPGIWAIQVQTIFHTGMIREGKQKARVLIDEMRFQEWMGSSGIGRSMLDKEPRSPQSAELKATGLPNLRSALEHIAAAAADGGYELTQDWLLRVLNDGLLNHGRKLSKNEFERAIWTYDAVKAVRREGGRLKTPEDDRRNQDRDKLVAIVAREFKTLLDQ